MAPPRVTINLLVLHKEPPLSSIDLHPKLVRGAEDGPVTTLGGSQ